MPRRPLRPGPEGLRFPMLRYARLRERCLAEGVLAPGAFAEPDAAAWEELALVHERGHLERVRLGRLTALDPHVPAILQEFRPDPVV